MCLNAPSAARFLADVERVYHAVGYVVIVVAETVRDAEGHPVGRPRAVADAFGHPQLAGTAATLCDMIGDNWASKHASTSQARFSVCHRQCVAPRSG